MPNEAPAILAAVPVIDDPDVRELEARRLGVLDSYEILGTPCEEAFDDLAKIAAQICDVPIALISFVGADRLWFKAHIGIEAESAARAGSFCDHAIMNSAAFVVPEARMAEQFGAHPFVTPSPDPYFYAGSNLVTSDGYTLGTLCVIDRTPRTLTDEQLGALDALGRQAIQLLELRRARVERDRVEAERVSLLAITQQERRVAQEARAYAEAATLAKDIFLATVSHELRTPLNAMVGWTRILRMVAPGDPMFAKGIAAIERSVSAQTQLIEDLLDVSRIISGQMRLDVRTLEFIAVVEAAVESIRPTADLKAIRLETILDPEASLMSGDVDRLQQVIWNLLTNAIKFTPKGGSVQVRLSRVDSSVELAVSDTGAGMSPELAPHVFDRFRQADGATTDRACGLGLGLSIVRHIAELHGGMVRCESPGEGLGSTFTVTLPVTIVRAAGVGAGTLSGRDQAALLAECVSLAGVKVLVVEDDPDSLEGLGTLLAMREAEVRTAESAEAALEEFERWIPDVLISDIGMPGRDGLELIRRVRALAPERGGCTPAVALTALARPEDRTRSLLAGFRHHMVKPVEPAELCAVVASLTGRT